MRWATEYRTPGARRWSKRAWTWKIGVHPSGVEAGTCRTRRGALRRIGVPR